MNLVGEGHKDGQCKQVAVQGVDMVNLRCEKRKADEVRPHRYSEVQVHNVDEVFMLQKMSRLCLYKENSPGESVRKLKAMFASGTMVSMQLSPLVSIKS